MRTARLACAIIALAFALPAHATSPAWFARLRAAAVARARAPLAGDALARASVEVARARAAGMPQLHLDELAHLGLDAGYRIELEAGVSVPLWAPAADADRRLTGARLAATRRQLAAERRAELHDALAAGVALLAAQARLRALDALTASLHAAGDHPRLEPPLRLVDIRLLAAGRATQLRRAEALRRDLIATLGIAIPPVQDATVPGPAQRPATPAPRTTRAATRAASATRVAAPTGPHPGARPLPAPPPATRDPLGFVAAQFEPVRCVAASDGVARAGAAAEDARLVAELARARARPHADLDLSGSTTLGDDLREARYAVRLGLSVSLPPWGPSTGAASLAVGAAGLEQSLAARWPNHNPAAPPTGSVDADATADVRDAVRHVRRQLYLLTGQEADLLVRRRILSAALARPRPPTLSGAYHGASLALRLADVDEALGATRLDAALLCGALPP